MNPISRSSAIIARVIPECRRFQTDARTRVHSKNFAQNRRDSSLDSHEVLWSAMRPSIAFQRESSDALIGSAVRQR